MSARALQADVVEFLGMLGGGVSTAEAELPAALCWPVTELDQALRLLARKSGKLTVAQQDFISTNAQVNLPQQPTAEAVDQWVIRYVNHLGLEAEPLQSTFAEVTEFLSNGGPLLLKLPETSQGDSLRFVVLVQGGRRRHQLLARDGTLHLVRHAILRDALWADVLEQQGYDMDAMLQRAGITAARQPQVKDALLQEIFAANVHHSGWLLRLSPRAGIWQQTKQAKLRGVIARLIGGYFIQLLLTLGAWWMIGKSTLAGYFDFGWLLGWALLLLTTIPFQAWMYVSQSELAIGLGALFKQRLLFGVMQLKPEEIRDQGAGQFLGRVLASDTVEQLGAASGLIALLALLQLTVAAVILALGSGGLFHAIILLLWAALTIGFCILYFHRSRLWSREYREMTSDLVERMVGHRTRLAQESGAEWHKSEDQLLSRYLQRQLMLDQIEVQLKALVPRGWMVCGVGGLLYAIIFTQPTTTEVAISLGGILFAFQALTTIVLGIKSITSTYLAWQEIRTIFEAAGRFSQRDQGMGVQLDTQNNAGVEAPIVTMRDIAFRYQQHGRPVLQGCDLEVYQGERLLLEGPSGGGKSTLAAILAGLRAPQSGLLLLHNVDQATMGLNTWRERVIAVPQFHENHILTGTLAFNLLLGRCWPPEAADLRLAEALCRELGLGELLERMPAGLQQMVGESGWQLSHGERSRIYIARALLQDSDLLILDESFAALDPENLERAMQCVLARAKTLVVIAHP